MKIAKGMTLTFDQMKELNRLTETVAGTTQYAKYWMEVTWKRAGAKNYTFIGYGTPFTLDECKFKCIKDEWWIMEKNNDGTRRYKVTDTVADAMGWAFEDCT